MYPTAESGVPTQRRGGSTYYAASYQQPTGQGAPAAPVSAPAAGPPPAPEFPPIPEFPTPPPVAHSGPGFPAPPPVAHIAPGLPAPPPVAHIVPGFPPPDPAHLPPPTAYGPAPVPARRSRALPIALGALGLVLVLFAGAAFVAYRMYLADSFAGEPTKPAAQPSAVQSATQPAAQPAGTGAPAETVTGDLSRFKLGDCLTVDDTNNHVEPAKCTAANAYKVLLRKDGTLDDSVCDTTAATMSLFEDGPGSTEDFVLCVGPAT